MASHLKLAMRRSIERYCHARMRNIDGLQSLRFGSLPESGGSDRCPKGRDLLNGSFLPQNDLNDLWHLKRDNGSATTKSSACWELVAWAKFMKFAMRSPSAPKR